MRTIVLFSQNDALVKRWSSALEDESICIAKDLAELNALLEPGVIQVILYDVDSLNFQIKSIMDVLVSFEQTYLFVLSGAPDFQKGVEYLQEHIAGYGNSYMVAENLKMALDVIASGSVWLYPEFIQRLISGATKEDVPEKVTDIRLELLTDKEKEVASLVAEGLSNKEIAKHLDITERTVKAHLTHIFEKLEISDRLTLALMIKG